MLGADFISCLVLPEAFDWGCQCPWVRHLQDVSLPHCGGLLNRWDGVWLRDPVTMQSPWLVLVLLLSYYR